MVPRLRVRVIIPKVQFGLPSSHGLWAIEMLFPVPRLRIRVAVKPWLVGCSQSLAYAFGLPLNHGFR